MPAYNGGLQLFESAYQKPSLEQWFLNSTNTELIPMLIKYFRIELLKIRRSLALLMLLACPLMVVLLVFGVGLRQTDAADFSEKTWFAMWQTSSAIWCYFMLPLYIALITGLLNGNEHKNQTWRLMLSLPISSRQLYFTKALLAWIFVIGANLLMAIYISLAALVLGLLDYPMQGAYEFPIWYAVASTSLACLPVLLSSMRSAGDFQYRFPARHRRDRDDGHRATG